MNTNGGLSWINYLDSAVLAASSEATGLPIGNLQVLHRSTIWRTDGTNSAAFTADFGAPMAVDIIGLFGANFTAGAQWRIRLSSTDAHDGDLHDSTLVAMNPEVRVDRRNPASIIAKSQALYAIADAPVTAQYLKVDLADSAVSTLEAGLAWAGQLWQPERNFAYGQAPAFVDPSTTTLSVGGNAYTDLRPQYMTDTFTLPALTEDESKTVEQLDAAVGTALNLLWVRNPTQANMNKTAILGRQLQIGQMPSIAHNRRTRQMQIAERL